MELHTLGVDAGYTQKDVQEVARCFTGWTINRQTGEFIFRPASTTTGSKIVLGHVIPAGGGMQDGETVLDILASSPACAHHLARNVPALRQRQSAAALVNRIAGVFTQTGGDLRAVTEAILTSPEFLSPSAYNNKIKSPLEFAVSAVRASESTLVAAPAAAFGQARADPGRRRGARPHARPPTGSPMPKQQSLNWHIFELGEPLFACTPPTGYGEVSKKWVRPGALIERLNFALALTQQQISDVQFDAAEHPRRDRPRPSRGRARTAASPCCSTTRSPTRPEKVLTKTAVPAPATSQTVNPTKLIALIIGSPEFQRK